MNLSTLQKKVSIRKSGYGTYKVTIQYRGKEYHCTSHNSLAYDYMDWEQGEPRGYYTAKQALQAFYDECKRANHLGEYNY